MSTSVEGSGKMWCNESSVKILSSDWRHFARANVELISFSVEHNSILELFQPLHRPMMLTSLKWKVTRDTISSGSFFSTPTHHNSLRRDWNDNVYLSRNGWNAFSRAKREKISKICWIFKRYSSTLQLFKSLTLDSTRDDWRSFHSNLPTFVCFNVVSVHYSLDSWIIIQSNMQMDENANVTFPSQLLFIGKLNTANFFLLPPDILLHCYFIYGIFQPTLLHSSVCAGSLLANWTHKLDSMGPIIVSCTK